MAPLHSNSGPSMQNHRSSGHTVNAEHFTGKQGSGAKRKQRQSAKQKRRKRGTHVNKYADDTEA